MRHHLRVPRPRVRHAGLVLLPLTLAACSASERPLLVAAAGNWTESYGVMNKHGIELALEEVNARGGIRGRELQLVDRDDGGDGTTAVNIAAEFVANAAILAVIGHVNSGTMVAASRVYDQGLPAVSTTASTPDLTGISPWVFRVISSDSVNGIDIARFARSAGFNRAAVLYDNDAYGRGLAESFERNFTGTVVMSDPIASDGRSDIEPHIAFLRQQQPDVVFVAGTDASGLAVLREARRQGLRAAMLGSDGWVGVLRDPAAAEGAWIATPFAPRDPRPEVRRFVEAFERRFNAVPDGNAALAYDATMLVARALEDGASTRRQIRDWLASRTSETAFPGVTGAIRFRSDGDVVGKGFVMTRVRDGALVVERDSRS